MNWKRNRFSYIAWFFYLVLTGYAAYLAAFLFCADRNFRGSAMVYGITGGVLLLAGLLSASVWFVKKKLPLKEIGARWWWKAAGILGFLAFLAGGVWLRVSSASEYGLGAYFDMAMITAGGSLPKMAHGAENIYVWILHGICFLLGNYPIFCIRFQVVLELLAGITCALGIRKLWGMLPMLTFSGFYFLSPLWAAGQRTLRPESLFLFFFGLGLLSGALFLKQKEGFPYAGLLAGIAAAFATYLDVLGLVLLPVLVTTLYVDRGRVRSRYHRPFWSLLTCLVSYGISFAGMLEIDAIFTGKAFHQIAGAWMKLFFAGAKGGTDLVRECMQGFEEPIMGLVMTALLAMGIFSFFMTGKQEKSTAVLLAMASTLGLGAMGATTSACSGLEVFGLTLWTLIGIAMGNVLCRGEADSTKALESMDKPSESTGAETAESSAVETTDNSGGEIAESLSQNMTAAKSRTGEDTEALSEGSGSEAGETEALKAEAHGREALTKKQGRLANFLEERKRKKEEQQREIEKVLNALSSLSSDPLIVSGPETKKEELQSQNPGDGKEQDSDMTQETESVQGAGRQQEPDRAKENGKTKESSGPLGPDRVFVSGRNQRSCKKKTSGLTERKDGEMEEEKKDSQQSDPRKGKPLDNPLPLPKKHVTNVMDYDYEVSEDDDFDIE